MYVCEQFGPRTCRNMEQALEMACRMAPSLFTSYEARKYVAERIRSFASVEPRTLQHMTLAGRQAAADLIVSELSSR